MASGNHAAVIAFVRKAYHGWRDKYGPSHPKTKEMRDWLVENDPEFDPKIRQMRVAAVQCQIRRMAAPDGRPVSVNVDDILGLATLVNNHE